jgi:hypothetical protein
MSQFSLTMARGTPMISIHFNAPVPIAVPTQLEKLRFAGSMQLSFPEMMTDDAKFVLGF